MAKLLQLFAIGVLAMPTAIGLAAFLGLLYGTYLFTSAWAYARLVWVFVS